MAEQLNRVGVEAVIEKPKTSFHYTPEFLGIPPMIATGKDVKICIIDSGVPEHEAITNIAEHANFAGTKEVRDFVGHSTIVSGLIIGNKENEFSGIAPDALAYYAKVIDDESKTRLDSIVAAILWGIIKECDIICLPLCSSINSPTIYDTVHKATESGILVISSMGLPGESSYPAMYDEVLAVGALTGQMHQAEFSGKGNVNLIGCNLISTYFDQKYAIVSGTSVATALTTGIAARFIEARRATGTPTSPNIMRSVMESALPRV